MSDISEGDRRLFEEYIAAHEPYKDDDPKTKRFDGDSDLQRGLAYIMKKLLEGKIK